MDAQYSGQRQFWPFVLLGREVNEILAERLPITIFVSLASLIVVYVLAIPIAILSAIYKYTWFDYLATTFGFIGLAMPSSWWRSSFPILVPDYR